MPLGRNCLKNKKLTNKKGYNRMNARIIKFTAENPAVPFTGEVNPCPFCTSLPRYARSEKCGGYHLGCECGRLRTESCTNSLTHDKANRLRKEWNEITLDAPLSQAFVDKVGAGNGSLCIIRSEDSAIISVYEDIIDPLAFLQKECKRDSSIDYDLCQFVRRCDGRYILAHVATSKILSFVSNWEGFNIDVMIKVDN